MIQRWPGTWGRSRPFVRLLLIFGGQRCVLKFFSTYASVICARGPIRPRIRVSGYTPRNPPSHPMEKMFIDFVSPLTRIKRGHSAILVVLDGFSKFVVFYPVRRISSQVVVDCLERCYFRTYGTPHTIVTDNATVFRCKQVKELCF